LEAGRGDVKFGGAVIFVVVFVVVSAAGPNTLRIRAVEGVAARKKGWEKAAVFKFRMFA